MLACRPASSLKEGVPPGVAVCLTAALMCLATLAAIELLGVFSWWLLLRPSPIVAFAAAAACAGASGAFACRALGASWRAYLASVSLTITVFAIALAVSMQFHDFSSDGQQYHQQAIQAFLDGWNPLRDDEYAGPYALWVNSYAKGTWTIAAVESALTGSIEAGKSTHLVMFAAVWLVSIAFAVKLGSIAGRLALLIGACLALNPVFGYQVFSYYVDGELGLLLTVLGMAMALASAMPTVATYGIGACALALLPGVKFTGLFFGAIYVACHALLLALTRDYRAAVRTGLVWSIALAIGTLAIGFNPYVTNLIRHGNPAYPLAGASAVDIISGSLAPEFMHRPRIEKLLLSLYSRSHSIIDPKRETEHDQVRLKIPGTLYPSELRFYYSRTDIRVGGLGPWFSLALTLAVIAALVDAPSLYRNYRRLTYASLPLLASIASVLLFPEGWWARYAPQLATVPTYLAVLVLAVAGSRGARWLAGSTLAVVLVNGGLVIALAFGHALVQESDFRAQVASLQQLGQEEPVRVIVTSTPSNLRRLQEAGVPIVAGSEDNCPFSDNLIGSDTRICLSEAQRRTYQRGSPLVERLLAPLRRLLDGKAGAPATAP